MESLKYFFLFTPKLGEDEPIFFFDEHIFQLGWFNHQLDSLSQWLNFKLSGITCLVGKIKFELFISGSIGPLAE